MLIPLRNYSNYSICESNIKIEDLVNFAEKEKLSAIALTDYKLLSGVLEFSIKCKNKGIQPIIGLDVDYLSVLNNYSRLTFLSKNESAYIPLGSKHRLSNPGNSPLILIEVQSGDYFGEDDIIRFQDKYRR